MVLPCLPLNIGFLTSNLLAAYYYCLVRKQISALFKQLHYYDYLIGIVLALSLLLRLSFLDLPFSGESFRDYLVGHNIVSHNELLINGPNNAVLGVPNGPVYYYFIALLLLLHDDIIWLSVANILLQCLILLLIYLAGKKLFSPFSGLMAASITSISESFLQQSYYTWQPYSMQPFLYLSLFFFLKAWDSKSKRNYYFGLAMMLIAGAIHNSAYAYLPAFLWLGYKQWKKSGKPIFKFLIPVGLSAVCIVLTNGPFFLSSGGPSKGLDLRGTLQSLTPMLNEAIDSLFTAPELLPWIIILVFLAYQSLQSHHKKINMLLLLSLQPVIFLALMAPSARPWEFYFISGLPLLLLAFSGLFSNPSIKQAPLIAVVTLLMIFSLKPGKDFFRQRYNPDPNILAHPIATYLKENKEIGTNFQIRSLYRFVGNTALDDLPIWWALQKQTGHKYLSNTEDQALASLKRPMGQHIFVICDNRWPNTTAECNKYIQLLKQIETSEVIMENAVFKVLLFKMQTTQTAPYNT
jgi:hypothetical protein